MRSIRTAVQTDLLWKALLESFIYFTLEIFYPELYVALDLSQSPKFLNKELRVPGLHKANKKRRFVDLLADLPLKIGNFVRILLHVEVEAQRAARVKTKEPFHVRMRNYACLIVLTHDCPFASLAIRITPKGRGEKLSYAMDCFGTRHIFEYPTVFIDQLEEDSLLALKENPVALAVVCAKRMLEAKKDEGKRFRYAKDLLTTMKARGYSKDTCLKLVQFIEGMSALSTSSMTRELEKEIDTILGEVEPVEVLTPIVKRVIRKRAYRWAREEGIAEGETRGKAEGILQEKVETAWRMLGRGMEIGLVAELIGLSEEDLKEALKTDAT